MFTPVPWLERNPTYKDQMEQLSHKDLATHGFLGYPVLQAADILMFEKLKKLGQPFAHGLRVWLFAHACIVPSNKPTDKPAQACLLSISS